MVDCFVVVLKPKNHNDAMKLPDADKWKSAELNKIKNLKDNKMQDLVDLPPGCKAIGVKWVYKIKTHPDGTIDKYKACLVAKGFLQKRGLDYTKTYAPVAKMTSIKVILAIAAHNGWPVH